MEARTYVFSSRSGNARLYVITKGDDITGMFFGSLTSMSARRRDSLRRAIRKMTTVEDLRTFLIGWELCDVFEGDGQLDLTGFQSEPDLEQTIDPPTNSRQRPPRSRRHDHLGT